MEEPIVEPKKAPRMKAVSAPGQEPVVEPTPAPVVAVETPPTTPETPPVTPTVPDIDDNRVLDYLKSKAGREFQSLDEILQPQIKEVVVEKTIELPEDVNTFLKYKKETGRGMQDFLKLNEDFTQKDPDSLIKEYYRSTINGLDDNDLNTIVKKFGYSEDDDEDVIAERVLNKKLEVAKARDFFERQREQYKIPSEMAGISKEEVLQAKQLFEMAKSEQEKAAEKAKVFKERTDAVLSQNFKGFEFDLGDKKVAFTPKDASQLKAEQSTPSTFLAKFTDEQGYVKDAAAYHRSIAIANNPEAFAKFFYEQGQAAAIEKIAAGDKNIRVNVNTMPNSGRPQAGQKFVSVPPPSR